MSWRRALIGALLALVPGLPGLAQETREGGPALPLSQLEAAVREHPDDPARLVDLGLGYWHRDDFPRALETFRRAVEVSPGSADAHNWLGVALSGKSDLPGAIAEFRKAIELDPEYGRAYSNLGSTLATSGDYPAAVEVFEKALALEPNSLGAHLNLGMALREVGDFDTALVHLRQVAEAEPGNAVIHYELGQTWRQSGDLAKAIPALERAIELDPELREGYYALGVALRRKSAMLPRPPAPAPSPADAAYESAHESAGRGELGAAREQLEEALRLDEAHGPAHGLLGFLLSQQGDLRTGLAHLERAVALQPGSAQAHYDLGAALWFSRSRERALAELRQAVELDPAAGGSHALLGTALRETGDLAGARASLQRAIALLPPTAAVYADLGITFLRSGELSRGLGQLEAGLNLPWPSRPAPDWEAAAVALRKALDLSPNPNPIAIRAVGHNVQGRLLGRLGVDGESVATEFRAALRLQPDYAEAHNNLGLVLVQTGDDAGGIAAFREALRIAPDYADALSNLGAALTPTDADEAIRTLEKAVELAPASVKAQFNLAAAYGASPGAGKQKEIGQLQKVIELAPDFARARVALGKALLRDGSVDAAIEQLEEAARLEPERGEAHYQLGLALARAGRKDEAAAALARGRELVEVEERDQTATLDLSEGRAALAGGDLELAASKLRRALRLRSDSPEAHRLMGEVLERQGDVAGAGAAYRKALELEPADAGARQGLERLTRVGSPAATPGADRIARLEGLIRAERFEEVEPLLAAYVEENPGSAWGWYALGYTYFSLQKVGDCIGALSKSLSLDVQNAEAHKILGRALMVIGRYDAAELEFEQAVAQKPDSAEIQLSLGKLHSIQDEWEPARQALEAALRLEPDNVEALDALGFALEALDDDAGAVATYERAIELSEAQGRGFASAHVNLAAYYNRAGDPQRALEYAERAVELDPRSDRGWFQKGRADERQGRLAEAVQAVDRAIELNPRSAPYYYVLAGLQRRLGNMEASREALASFKKLQSEADELEKRRRDTRRDSGPAGSGE